MSRLLRNCMVLTISFLALKSSASQWTPTDVGAPKRSPTSNSFFAIEEVLHKVQQLDPPGVAARDLQECLQIQLTRKTQTPDIELANDIVTNAFDQFTKTTLFLL